jgi:aminopeptidase-like protein
MYRFMEELFPICRSITGPGIRETLQRIRREVPLSIKEVPSGTRVLDWTVPPEWTIRDAFIARNGRRVVDFQASNLHVVQYSRPVHQRMSLAELRPHLHTLEAHPEWIPYRTSYWNDGWGFCLSRRQLDALSEGEYEVGIDSTLEPGALVFGELVVPGSCADEMLLSCHICHPALANDNLSGLAVAVETARQILASPHRLTYRFLFIPGTIGSIAWLAQNEAIAHRVRHGLVLSCLGDAGPLTYKRSRRGDAPVDHIAEALMAERGLADRVRPFSPYGYDERQYCSPGFDLPVGCLTRTPNGEFPEYHTSADNLGFVTPSALLDSLEMVRDIVARLETTRRFTRVDPRGEPQLGRRGLYHGVGGIQHLPDRERALLWVLSLVDHGHSLAQIARLAGLPLALVEAAADTLIAKDLIREA